jgi:excisionase family DNA binding protein
LVVGVQLTHQCPSMRLRDPGDVITGICITTDMLRTMTNESLHSAGGPDHTRGRGISPFLLTVRHVADATGVGEPRIRDEVNKGRLAAKRIGVSVRVRPADLDAWIDKQEDVYTE